MGSIYKSTSSITRVYYRREYNNFLFLLKYHIFFSIFKISKFNTYIIE